MPEFKLLNTPVVFVYVIPSILKVNPERLEVTLIEPVATVHVGCVVVAVGAEGEPIIVKFVAVLQPFGLVEHTA